LAWLVHHSRRTLRIIRKNIVFSLTVKAAFVLLTFAGLASLWGAIRSGHGRLAACCGKRLEIAQIKGCDGSARRGSLTSVNTPIPFSLGF
jgi:hypothetical protein